MNKVQETQDQLFDGALDRAALVQKNVNTQKPLNLERGDEYN